EGASSASRGRTPSTTGDRRRAARRTGGRDRTHQGHGLGVGGRSDGAGSGRRGVHGCGGPWGKRPPPVLVRGGSRAGGGSDIAPPHCTRLDSVGATRNATGPRWDRPP